MLHSSVFLYGVTVLIWGSTWFAIKFQLGVVALELSVAYRCGLSAFLLLGFAAVRGLRLRFSFKDHLFLLLEGFLLFCINYLMIYKATESLTTGLVAVLFSTFVFMNVFNSALFFKQPVRKDVLIGAVTGLAGIVMVFWKELSNFNFLHGNSGTAVLICLLGTYMASLGNMVALRNQKKGLPILQSNGYGMLYGTLLLLIFAGARGVPLNYDITPAYTISLLYLALFGTVIAFGTYMTLLGRIGADRAAYATVLFPVIALGISTFFENYQWTALSLSGVLLVLSGNVLSISKGALRRLVRRCIHGDSPSSQSAS